MPLSNPLRLPSCMVSSPIASRGKNVSTDFGGAFMGQTLTTPTDEYAARLRKQAVACRREADAIFERSVKAGHILRRSQLHDRDELRERADWLEYQAGQIVLRVARLRV